MRTTSAAVEHREADNRRRAVLLLGGVALVVFLLVVVLAALVGLLLVGLVAGLVLGGVAAFAARAAAPSVVLGRIPSRPADEEDFPRLHNVVEGLCAGLGVAKPEVRLVDDDAPDACAVGVDHRRAVLVVTTGLLDRLTRVELEAVVAHELAHIRYLDILPATLAAALLGVPLAPLDDSARRAVAAAAPHPEAAADLDAVALTRYPPALLDALEKIHAEPHVDRGPVTSQLWLAAHRPTLAVRVETLREL